MCRGKLLWRQGNKMLVAICDEDVNMLSELENKLKSKYQERVMIQKFKSITTLFAYAENEREQLIDVLVIDIRVGQEDGISAVMLLREKQPQIKTVFLAKDHQFVPDIFEADPVYFLMKPVGESYFYRACDKVETLFTNVTTVNSTPESLFLRHKAGVVAIAFSDILYMESSRRTIFIHTDEKVLLSTMKLTEMEKKLSKSFLRVHQSFIVNMDHIQTFFAKEITLKNGQKIPVSRQRDKASKQIFKNYTESIYKF